MTNNSLGCDRNSFKGLENNAQLVTAHGVRRGSPHPQRADALNSVTTKGGLVSRLTSSVNKNDALRALKNGVSCTGGDYDGYAQRIQGIRSKGKCR